MIEIYVLLGMIIIGIIGSVIGIKKNIEYLFSGSLIVLMIAIIFIFFTLMSNTTKKEVSRTLKKYDELKEKVEVIKNCNDTTLDVFKEDLSNEVYEINKTIRIHKDNYQSNWNGWKYSEELANLNKIELW